MRLNIANLKHIAPVDGLVTPRSEEFELPEKILLFGTGVFVRGLIVYLIDRANKRGLFGGRIVMVKSTSVGDTQSFQEQDNLYTLVMKSNRDGADVEEKVICSAISRTLEASTAWNEVIACAKNKDLSIIISNTTEVGIVLDEGDSPDANPPRSYPMKLLAFLKARYDAFDGSAACGMIVIPTELIPDNAQLLKSILNKLAARNGMDQAFIDWMNTANDFCSSLVDRIVPGKISGNAQLDLQRKLGYEDDLMVMSETFGLWAIETANLRTQKMLSFERAFPNIYIVPNIDKFRELKLRLLNGSHNLSCAVGFLAGFKTVREAMADPLFDAFMRQLILRDIAQAILSEEISLTEAEEFGSNVLERYRNPHIAFDWLSICVQDTSKIKIRAVPIVLQHYHKHGYVPDAICLGFAAYILFMKGEFSKDGSYHGTFEGQSYSIDDDFARRLHDKWKSFNGSKLVDAVLEDEVLWGTNLATLTGFVENVSLLLESLIAEGTALTVKRVLKNGPRAT